MQGELIVRYGDRKAPKWRRDNSQATACWRRHVWIWVVVTWMAGCGHGGLDLAPVEGVVTFEGAPVADAGVRFTPAHGPSADGVTDGEGRFTLITANQPGALVGDHRVAISKTEATAIPQQRGFPLYRITEHIPAQFGDASMSGLTATVLDDDNRIDFNLTAK